MEKIKLSVNEKLIEVELAACENAGILMQQLYGALKEAGIVPATIEDLIHIQSKPASGIEDYVKSEMIAKHESEQPLEVAGMPVDPEKLKDMITVTGMSNIKRIKNKFDQDTVNAFRFLTLSGGIVSLKTGYEDVINEKHTLYASGPRQIDAVKKLTEIRDAINTWMEFRGVTDNQSLTEIKGLIAGEPVGRYSLDVGFITGL